MSITLPAGTKLPRFITIHPGCQNVVRITGKPFGYRVHYYSDQTGKLRRAFCEGDQCKCCKNDLIPAIQRRPSSRYSMWVIQNKSLAILEVGKLLFGQIAQVVMATSEPTENYDIGISRSGEKFETTYSVDRWPILKYQDEFWKDIQNTIGQFSMKGLVGDPEARELMLLDIQEEERVLNKSW